MNDIVINKDIITGIDYKDKSEYRKVKNQVFKIIVIVMSVITISPIVLILSKLIIKGIRQINLDFFTQVAPDTFEAMTAISNGETIPGGIANGITGTLLIVIVASIIAIPVGVLTGIYLYENQGKRYANLIRNIADVLQGVPSIVLGIIGYLWVVINITSGFSALAGSFALAIMMLPLIVRSTEETMKMVPESIKEAGIALGVPYHKIILRVMIPSSFSGLMTGILLAISRILGETAPLLLTTLGSPVINLNISQPTSAVPLLIWNFYNDPNMINLIWSSSLFLMGLVLTLNIISRRVIAKRS
jgi:phosphate transport system permease protein